MKRITVIAAAMSLSVLSLGAIASADTLILRDGTRVTGTVVNIVERTITFEDDRGVSRKYSEKEVDSLVFTSSNLERAASANSGRLEGLARLLARPDPKDLPRRGHVLRCEHRGSERDGRV